MKTTTLSWSKEKDTKKPKGMSLVHVETKDKSFYGVLKGDYIYKVSESKPDEIARVKNSDKIRVTEVNREDANDEFNRIEMVASRYPNSNLEILDVWSAAALRGKADWLFKVK